MKRNTQWLLVVLLLAFLFTPAVVAAEEGEASGAIEIGASGLSVDNNDTRVNEYSTVGKSNGADLYGKASVEATEGPYAVELDVETKSADDLSAELKLDAARIFRLQSEYQKFNHFLPHDQLNYMDATMLGNSATLGGGANPAVYGEDLVADEKFMIIHRKWENEAKLTLPSLPNVTLKAGLRIEEREGTEQAIGISHCSACHVTGESRNVDESTTDFTIGATGKFGALTVDYEFLTRDFEENASPNLREYLQAGKPIYNATAGASLPFAGFQSRLLYEDDEYIYNTTPDSEKDVHSLKARLDMSNNTVMSAAWINADVESTKQDDVGLSLENNTLSTEYDSYSFRASTRLTDALRVSAFGRYEELEASDNVITFHTASGSDIDREYESEEAREVTTLGANALYRLGKGTSLRVGYEYEEVDREIDEIILDIDVIGSAVNDTREIKIDETITHTVKAALRFRPATNLNGRVSYMYQNIDDPFMHHFGNKGPESLDTWTGGTTQAFFDGKRWYGTAFYNLRQAEATNQPEDVHEIKASTTWTPGPDYSVTVYARYRTEESDLNFNTYEQDTFSPGVNVWWAPINNLNMTMAYNFNKMKTENQMCVGWYHG